MENEKACFESIRARLVNEDALTSEGKMMSAPAIKYDNKVFTFYYNQEMVFRLGKDFNPAEENIQNYRLLNPFKNKPPMAGWFQISFDESQRWEELARRARTVLISEINRG